VIYLDAEDLLDIAAMVLDPQPVIVRDLGLLSMSAHRPQTQAFGHEPYPTVADKAAALLVSICMNHPLQDGNKRLALAAAWAFCDLNVGHKPKMSNVQAFNLVMGVARGDIDLGNVSSVLCEAGIDG
jgi:death on curing protein